MSNNGQEMDPSKSKNHGSTKSKRNPNESRRGPQRSRSTFTLNMPGTKLNVPTVTHTSTYISFPGGKAILMGADEEENPKPLRKGQMELTMHFVMKNDLIDILDDKEAALDFQRALGTKPVQYVFEGVRNKVSKNLDEIWTDILITMEEREDVNKEHKVSQTESASSQQVLRKREIRLLEMFRTMPGQEKPVRTLLTIGAAGIGKTVMTRKYVLDWARKCSDDQEIKILVPFRLKDFNRILGTDVSFRYVIQVFFKQLEGFSDFNIDQVLFILDGLDEFNYPLDFKNNEVLTDINKITSIDVILTSLINGYLLPLARVWITTRPAAGKRIPLERVDRVTELLGFTKPNRAVYFKKRYSRDENLARRMISHIRTSESLQTMCHLPVFCWMTAIVLEHYIREDKTGNLPITAIELYMHFLAIESKTVDAE